METPAASANPLHIFFFPSMAPGHMIPMIHMANLFSSRGVKSTIISTPISHSFLEHHCTIFQPTPPSQVQLLLLPSPQNTPQDLPTSPDVFLNNLTSLPTLRGPFRQLLDAHRPDCIVSDMFFPWTNDVAVELNIPRLAFHGVSAFSLCVIHNLDRKFQHTTTVLDQSERDSCFVVPGLPDRVELTKSEIPDFMRSRTFFSDLAEEIWEADDRSYGAVVNSFYDVESDYFDHYRNIIGKKVWHVGPLFLSSTTVPNELAVDQSFCSRLMSWLDSNEPDSVVYVCFGSLSEFTVAQSGEIATALLASNRPFVWVVGKASDCDEWISSVFGGDVTTTAADDHVHGIITSTTSLVSVKSCGEVQGMLVREWAPQVEILSHPAVGGFVTHCGWNSVLEGMCARGVPMVAWPLDAEQFYNEKQVVEVLGVGVNVGAKVWTMRAEERPLIEASVIAKAISQVMSFDVGEGNSMRTKARELGEKGRRAVVEGGSSWTTVGSLIDELNEIRR